MTSNATTNAAAMHAELTPTQVRGLKLIKDGNVHPQEGKKWTHLNASETYARSDRFKERPLKVKFLTTATLEGLRGLGLIQAIDDASPEASAHAITMAGKMWLLRHK